MSNESPPCPLPLPLPSSHMFTRLQTPPLFDWRPQPRPERCVCDVRLTSSSIHLCCDGTLVAGASPTASTTYSILTPTFLPHSQCTHSPLPSTLTLPPAPPSPDPHRLQSDPVSTTEPFFEPADIGRVFQTDPTQNERGPVGEPPPGYHPAPSSTPSFHSAFSVQVGPPLMCHLDPQCMCEASSCHPAS